MNKGKRICRIAGTVLGIIYLAVLGYLLFFSQTYRVNSTEYQYNMIPFHEIRRYAGKTGLVSLTNLFGNVLAFVPFGFLVTIVSGYRLKWPVAVALCLAAPVAVELLQLVTRVGICDVDDVILNFAGGLIGLGLYELAALINRRLHRDCGPDGNPS